MYAHNVTVRAALWFVNVDNMSDDVAFLRERLLAHDTFKRTNSKMSTFVARKTRRSEALATYTTSSKAFRFHADRLRGDIWEESRHVIFGCYLDPFLIVLGTHHVQS